MRKLNFGGFDVLFIVSLSFYAGCVTHSANWYVDSSRRYLTQNRPAEALREAERAIEIDPHSYLGHNNRSATLIVMQRYFDALQSAEEAISLKPDLALAHLNKGRALYHIGHYEEALKEFDVALSTDMLHTGSLKTANINLAKRYKLGAQLELSAISLLEGSDSERLKLALGGVPVFSFERAPQSQQDPYWHFGCIFYVSDISPASYLQVDDADFIKSEGAIDYVRTKTDTGYEESYKLATPRGRISVEETAVVNHKELKILTSCKVTQTLTGRVKDMYLEKKLEAYDSGTLVRMRLRVSPLKLASALINEWRSKINSYLAWLSGVKPLSDTITKTKDESPAP